ncbi:MAG: ParA family protein [Holophagales bacterium]|nr:ParA family protein [Holophagales bacterium]
MEIWTVTNRKGGVGKTTTAHALAHGLARRGRRVLALDLDTQGHLSAWCDAPPDAATLADVVTGGLTLFGAARDVWRPDEGPGLVDLVAGGDRLYLAESEIDRRHAVPQLYLSELLEGAPADAYDVAVIDTAPSLSVLWAAAIVAASAVVAPTEPSGFGVEALAELRARLDQLARLNSRIGLAGVVLTPFDGRTRLGQDAADAVREMVGEVPVWTVRRNIRITEAFGHRESIFTYAPESHGAEDYARIVEDLDGRLGEAP